MLAAFATLTAGGPASAQVPAATRVFLDDIEFPAGDTPVTRLYVRVESGSTAEPHGIDPSAFEVRDNGNLVEADAIELTTIADAHRGTSAVLVLDSSRSMRGQPFDQAKRAALGYLEQMGDLDQVAVIAFHNDVEVVGDFGTEREVLRDRIASLRASKKTLSKRVWDGATRGLQLITASRHALPRRVFMIIFSDGRDSGSNTSLEGLLEMANGGNRLGRTPIFSVGYMEFGGAGLPDLERVSAGTGADLYQLHSPLELADFFDDITSRMNQSFVLSYPTVFDGERHEFEVAIRGVSDVRTANSPQADDNTWPALAGALALAVAGFFAFRRVRGGRPTGELVIVSGPGEDSIHRLTKQQVRIGAYDDNDLVLNYPSISRFHARLQFTSSGAQLEDLGSKNGTFINEQRIYRKGSIRAGDRVRFGKVELFYRI